MIRKGRQKLKKEFLGQPQYLKQQEMLRLQGTIILQGLENLFP